MSTVTQNLDFTNSAGTYWYCSHGSSKYPFRSTCTVSVTRNYGESNATVEVTNIQMKTGWGDYEDWRIIVSVGGKTASVDHIGYNKVSYNSDNMHKQHKWYTFPSDIKLTVPADASGGKLSITIQFVVGQGFLSGKAPWGDNGDGTYTGYDGNKKTVSIAYDSMGASTITSVSNVTLGNKTTIKFTPYSSSFYYKVKFVIGSWNTTSSKFSYSTVNTEYSREYTIPLDVANQITTSTTGTITAYLYTYSDSDCTKQIGSASTKTFTATVPTDIIPTISSGTFSLVNDNSVIDGWGIAVQGYTKVNLKASASGSYGSTISSFIISSGVSATVNGYVLNYTSDAIATSGSKHFNIVAVDSRGRKSAAFTTNLLGDTSTTTVTVYAYSVPLCTSFSVSRINDTPKKVTVNANWSYSSVKSKNSVTAKVSWMRDDSTAWSSGVTITRNTPKTLTQDFSEDHAYKFRVIITDSLGKKATDQKLITTMEVFMDWRVGGKGLGVGMVAPNDGFCCKWNAYFYGDIIKRIVDTTTGNITEYTLKDYIKGVVNGTIK